MEITWLGHSAVKIKGSKTLFIDPFFSGNPCCPTSPREVKEADIVIVTHHHSDHLGDAFVLAKKTRAVLVGVHEIAVDAQAEGITAEGMNVGGTIEVKGVKIHMVVAHHSAEKGCATGVVVEMDGRRLYHAGDTGLTYDMKLVAEFFRPDLSFIPIGDRYTMGIPSAVKAVEFTQTKRVIPVHYNTFPIIQADAQEFKRRVGAAAEVIVLKPGDTYTL
ncbi:MAG: metal-dependent hydrolase [Candidatus Aminicenantales bacterium]